MGELEGCWATPSTVSPQAPPASCPSSAPSDRHSGCSELTICFCCFAAIATAKDGARWSQPVPANSAHCWGPRQTRATVLIVSCPFWLASLLLEVGVQGSGVFPVLPVGLGVRQRSLRIGLIS